MPHCLPPGGRKQVHVFISFSPISSQLLDELPLSVLSRALADVLSGTSTAVTREELSDLFEDAWSDLALPDRARLQDALIASGLREGLVCAGAPDVVRGQRLVEQLLLPVPARYFAGLRAVRDLLGEGRNSQAQVRLHALLRGATEDLCDPGSGTLSARVERLRVSENLRPHLRDMAAMLRERNGAGWQCLWLGRLLDGLCDGGHPHPAVLIGEDARMLQTAIAEL